MNDWVDRFVMLMLVFAGGTAFVAALILLIAVVASVAGGLK